LTPTAGSNFARYVLPDNTDPDGVCCVSVPVPDDPQWRAAFHGALWRLSLQTNWQRDDNKLAKVVAARWREVWSEVGAGMGTCTPSDAVMRRAIQADFRLALSVEFTANGLDGIAPERPDTFFDEDSADAGDEIQQRSNALCLACQDFVNSVADDAISVARTAGLTVIPTLAPIVFGIAPIPGAIFIGAIASLSLIAQLAFSDEEIRQAVACCMYENLQGLAITEANFAASLTGCGFAALSDEEIVREILESGVNDRADYLAFVSVLGSFFASVGSAEIDCVCGTWEHTFDFEVSDGGWENRAEDNRPHGVYSAGVGWVSVYAGEDGTPPADAERLYIQIEGVPQRTVLRIEAQWLTTGGAAGDSTAGVAMNVADVRQDIVTEVPFDGDASPYILVWTGEESFDEIETTLVSRSDDGAEVYILKKVIVTGRGTDPF